MMMQSGKHVTLATKKRRYTALMCWLFMMPTLIAYLAFTAWPILASAYYSMLDWSGLSKSRTFVGLNNYVELLSDTMYWNAFQNSLRYTVLAVPLIMVVSLLFAYVLNSTTLRGKEFFRTLYFIPVVTTSAIMGIVMVFIFGAKGPVNALLLTLRLLPKPVNWLGDAGRAMTTVVIISMWKDMGTYMIYWLAGFQSLSNDIYEAAEVDGATKTRTLISVVLPNMLPVAGTIAVLCTINSLKVFDIIKTMTNGGPFFATDVIGTRVYDMAFSSQMGMPRLGYASAGALLFGLIVIAATLVLQNLGKIANAWRSLRAKQ